MFIITATASEIIVLGNAGWRHLTASLAAPEAHLPLVVAHSAARRIAVTVVAGSHEGCVSSRMKGTHREHAPPSKAHLAGVHATARVRKSLLRA